ncbi:MAG: septal ring lytic transglycosylase RlpA family protein [Planctomycetota bacterium]
MTCAAAAMFGCEQEQRAERPDQVGVASWYGERFAGRPTASGEPFDPSALTAAHRSLPFGTRVRVTHLANDRSVIVRINDRGPHVEGRIIDLSRAAAEKLGMVEQGTARVSLDVLDRAGRQESQALYNKAIRFERSAVRRR